MGNRTTRLISALFAGILAGAPLSAMSQNAPTAKSTTSSADACLASPGSSIPQGQRWYYYTERTTKRRCWFLGKEDGKVTQNRTATTTRKSTPPPSRSVQDAHAELASSEPDTVPDAPALMPAQNAAPTLQAASTTPAKSSDEAPATEQLAPDQPTATELPAPETTTPSSPTAVVSTSTNISAEKPTTSLRILLLFVAGALTLAGIMSSVIRRFRPSHTRVQTQDRARNRVKREPMLNDEQTPQTQAAVASSFPRAKESRLVDSSFAQPDTNRRAAVAGGTIRTRTTYPESTTSRPKIATRNTTAAAQLDAKPVPRVKESRPVDSTFAQSDTNRRAAVTSGTIRTPTTYSESTARRPKIATRNTTAAAPLDAQPVVPRTDADCADAAAVDIDAIITALERLTKEVPKPSRPISTGSPGFRQNRRTRFDVHA